MSWTKDAVLTRNDILTLAQLGTDLHDSYIITRYKEEKDGVILLATNMDQLIEMIDDTVPEDAIFELWVKDAKDEDRGPYLS